MTFFYISDDLENDVRRCIQSWERQYPIAIRGLTVEGEVKHFAGTVQTIDHDSKRAIGRLWRDQGANAAGSHWQVRSRLGEGRGRLEACGRYLERRQVALRPYSPDHAETWDAQRMWGF
jgi:hypothetical protein